MSSSPRDGSRDRADSSMLKHQHSFSDSGRVSIPMWDSSDPDRAPPPLPLNPGISGSPATRPNVSARIEEAAAVITARARENAPSSYTTHATPSGSPEKSPTKPQHKRMQSIQGGSIGVKGLSESLERRSPDKGLRTTKLSEYEEYRASRSPERSPTRAGSETPTPSGRVTPSHLNKPILGENTPPSATMLALQSIRNRQESEVPLSNITNNTSSFGRTPLAYDAISSQILSLTSIATNLQREMAQLSRRSKDNATDLLSLKNATNTRDEDIRKSLRDLVQGLDTRFSNVDSNLKLLSTPEASRSTPNLGLYLDSKPHEMTPGKNTFTLPRIPSPTSFCAAIDRDWSGSPAKPSADSAETLSLLNQVLREMGTIDGQEKILDTLGSVKLFALSNSNQTVIDPKMMQRLEDILLVLKEMKESTANRALVKSASARDGIVSSMLDAPGDDPLAGPLIAQTREMREGGRVASSQPSPIVDNEILKILKNVKQSLSQGGGLTNEVKALVRELRGEVLGMGREIARKLDQADSAQKSDANEPGTNKIADIVESGLAELKEHMHHLVQENQRQSAGSTRSLVDTEEVAAAVRAALAEMPLPRDMRNRDPRAEREGLLASIKEAWEDCKPEVALEHFGLERDEILETLKEGLKTYQSQQATSRDVGISYEEVLDAVQKGIASFKPPSMETQASIARGEILVAVREFLESFEFPKPPAAEFSTRGVDFSRDDILNVVKEGLSNQAPFTKEIEFNREDLFDAVRASLEARPDPIGGVGERVLEAMHDFVGSMKTEFQQYSAANGKDTEQVLDAMKDGLEELRADIESYVDRAADVTGKDEIIDTLKAGFAVMQSDLEKGFSGHSNTSRGAVNTPELLDAMEKEFEHLRESISKTLAKGGSSSQDKEDILDAIRDIVDDRQSSLSSNSEDVVRLVKEELEHMRTTLASTLLKSGGTVDREEILDTIREGLDGSRNPIKNEASESILSNTSELLDAFQEGVDGIRTDMQKLMNRPVDLSASYGILDTLKAGLDNVRADIERLHEKQNDLSETATARGREVVVHDENLISTEIEGLKVMITQLRIKVEALDNVSISQQSVPSTVRMHREDLNDIQTAIKEVHHSVNNVRSAQEVPLYTNTASKDDTDAIETLLRNVKAKLDDFSLTGDIATTEHLATCENILQEIKDSVEDSAIRSVDSVSKDDFTMVELLLKEVALGVEELQSKMKSLAAQEDRVSRADIQAVESLCLDTKTQIEELPLPDIQTLPTKDDISSINKTIKNLQEQIETENNLSAQAFEARKIEHGGLASKIEDVKGILGDLQEELLSKLDGSEEGIIELANELEKHHKSMSTYATAKNLSELSELVNREFERFHDHHVSTKNQTEEGHAMLLAKNEDSSLDMKAMIEYKFNDLMMKYDDAQLASEAKLNALNARDSEHVEVATTTKAVVEDLKLLIDALGTSLTGTCDRMSDDAKTVYNRVDHANTKIDELRSMSAHEHSLTREQVSQTLATATRLDATISEQQPTILAAIKEVLGLVGQHYEHAQQQSEHFSRAHEEIRNGVNAIPSAIPPLLPALPAPTLVREIPVAKEYDDSQVHDKLNNLIKHTVLAKEAFAKMESYHQSSQESLTGIEKLDNLEKIHAQVMATAEEVSAMVATQKELMTEHHESRAAEATEAAIALEKRTAQKEKVEAEIIALTEEKEALRKLMAAMKREQEDLSGQTKKLTREVAKLETALSLRQEEMRDMDARAENLERRILEGVMNHARSVHLKKPTTRTRTTTADRDRAMSLKRVPSAASTTTTKTSTRDGNSTIGGAVGIALKGRTPLGSASNSIASSRPSGMDRRILSTSYVTGNRLSHVPDRALMLAPPKNIGLASLKRSHSVKSNPGNYFGARKVSWTDSGKSDISSIADKENHVFDEGDEDDNNGSVDDEISDAGTERRTSFSGTSGIYTDSLTYGTGSSLSTHSARTASYASSVGGAVGDKNASIVEEDEEGEDDTTPQDSLYDMVQDDESAKIMALLRPSESDVNGEAHNSMAVTTFEGLETPATLLQDDFEDKWLNMKPSTLMTTGDVVKYNQPTDSGLGTEPSTADEMHSPRRGEAQEYFAMSKTDQEGIVGRE